MEQSSKLPLLPSERKAKVTELSEQSNVHSPTQVVNLEIKPSDSTGQETLPENVYIDSNASSPAATSQQKDHDLQDLQDRKARNEQIGNFDSLPPLPVATAADQLLHFMNITTNFMNKLEMDVSDRITELSQKIDSIDRKVGLMESKRKLEGEND
mmetsp:Transcript_2179/g.3304  ORF Transcript_2179/g.3304 Transcript_2179/m.3304 type:complete len:155 (-) Transcript_2179:79-543(-)